MTEHLRIPTCTCKFPNSVSPLLCVRWKRLIVDEGHNLSNKSSAVSSLTKLLSVERRWMVSGTPTPRLLGIGWGLQDPVTNPPGASVTSYDSDANFRRCAVGRWPASDRADLNKLDAICTHFLRIPQFVGQSRQFTKTICEPLFYHEGPGYGAAQILQQLLSQIMIRHRSIFQ